MSLLSRLAVQAARAYGVLSAVDKTKVSAEYLVVAGGGSGGQSVGFSEASGGGGAGGYRTSTTTLSTLNTYTVTVGAGGAAVTTYGTLNKGSNSVFNLITSTGGGGGQADGGGEAGGSGGGGGAGTSSRNGGAGNTPSTSPSQGNNGGNGFGSATSSQRAGGGGGGASAVGATATASTGGAGGAGSASSISGSSVTYAGGGGGHSLTTGGAGGSGGGGAGGSGSGASGTNGTANRGGGGGGANGGSSGAGGSGIVIISYTSATPRFVGGTITTSSGKQIHTFTSSGTLSPLTPVTASYLVVAGGGAGGGGSIPSGGGGGGAGGYQTSSTTLYSGATYIVTVGAGGASSSSNATNGGNGSNSVVSGTGLTTITSTGGGGGGVRTNAGTATNGSSGGSGGGGGWRQNATGGSGTSGQGNAGGNSQSTNTSGYGAGGGGGGAGAVGQSSPSDGTAGNGGNGSSSSISGSSVTYAGGGGGGSYNPSDTGAGGTGGTGGGGNGKQGLGNGSPGTANLGGGGGGSGGNGTTDLGGSGGSGIVIISYAGSQVFNGGLVTSSGGNTIHTFTATGALTPLTNNLNNSLRFRGSASAYLNRTPTLAGNRTTWTWSAWVKRGTIDSGASQYFLFSAYTASTDAGYTAIFISADTLRLAGHNTTYRTTTQVFRDPSAWYHLVVVWDTTQGTASNRIKIYVNGSQVTAFSTSNDPTSSQTSGVNAAGAHAIGANSNTLGTSPFDGYMTDINFIDGQALEPYYFGNNDANGVWKPIKYTGTYGTNGFYLTFGNTTSTTTLGYDSSGNNNNWTTNNISLTAGVTYDAMLDVPTNTSATVANYAVLNPLDKGTSGTLDRANLQWSSSASWQSARGTMTIPSGKFYFEGIITSTTSGSIGVNFGLATAANPLNVGGNSNTASYSVDATSSSNVLTAGSQSGSGSTFAAGDVLQYAIDRDNNRAWFGRNNTWYNSTLAATGDPVAGTNATWSSLPADLFPFINTYSQTVNFNFGQRPFSYTPPTGFVALNTYNLPTPTILQGNKYMDATLYTGTGTTQVIVNQGQFKPDFVWIKSRSNITNHTVYDSVRGFNASPGSPGLFSNLTDAEGSSTNTVSSANSNGFTIAGSSNNLNTNAYTFVGWQWQAGQGTNTTNTSGSITSTVSVNATAGFSIVTYTGTGSAATVGHGLGVAPKMVITKKRNGTSDWAFWITGFAGTELMELNGTSGKFTGATVWNSTTPTSTVFSVGSATQTNNSGGTYVAYLWSEIAGFSKFGSYTGNGSTDGPFVYLGFRPKFILIKVTSAANDWGMYDSTRNPTNLAGLVLRTNASSAEANASNFDFLSNGFKLRNNAATTEYNGNGSTYIYAAFAENPFKNANAR